MASKLVDSWMHGIPDPAARPIPYLLTAVLLSLLFYSFQSPDIPLLKRRRVFEFTDSRLKQEFVVGARRMLRDWFKANPRQAYPCHQRLWARNCPATADGQ